VGREEQIIQTLLEGTGITVNGTNDFDPQIHNKNFYGRVLGQGSLGLGEAYMDGWWDCARLDEFFYRVLSADADKKISLNLGIISAVLLNTVTNVGRKSKAFEVGQRHYDIGNDLYQIMLGKRMAYTCGYWNGGQDLDAAQEAKLDLVCRKIDLRPGQSVLDIGSGWGSFLGYAAQKYGAKAIGVSVSKEQKAFADRVYKDLPVETRLQDYREILGEFDHVVSSGMFEHVGYKNYRNFMQIVNRVLKDDGLFLLHTIGGNQSVKVTDRWISKYIFPNSMLPSITQIGRAIEGLFVMEDWHNFGADYDKTLMAWHANFANGWNDLKTKYSSRFYRMWTYFLLSCAGSARARKNQLWQIVLSKTGVPRGYKSIR